MDRPAPIASRQGLGAELLGFEGEEVLEAVAELGTECVVHRQVDQLVRILLLVVPLVLLVLERRVGVRRASGWGLPVKSSFGSPPPTP